MAVVKGPLFSLGASGQIAKSLVYSVWKGLKTVRQHVVPSNPQTADQTTQREAMADCVSAWRNYFTATLGRGAWSRLALTLSKVMSGFNAFVSNAAKIIVGDADASFCNTAAAIAANKIEFTMLNIDDGAAGDEAGNFEIWVGDSPSSLLLSELVAIGAGKVTGTEDLGAATDVVYAKVRKGSQDRSGIFKLTLID